MAFQIKDFGLSKTIEAQVLNNINTVIKFDINETNLDNMLVHAMAVMYDPVTVAPSKRPIINVSHLYSGFITLVNDNNIIFNQSLPMELFFRDPSGIIVIHPKLINIRNSFIELPQIANGPVLPAGGASIAITFFYKMLDKSIHKLSDIGELEF